MEQGIDLLPEAVSGIFGVDIPDIRTYSPLTLAYIGDAVYELVIRTYVTISGNAPVQKLHHRASEMVKAHTQSEIYKALWDDLSDEERDVMRRGRNARSYTKARNATTSDYRRATGVEALMGYLYLTGRYDRALELIRLGLEKTEMLQQ